MAAYRTLWDKLSAVHPNVALPSGLLPSSRATPKDTGAECPHENLDVIWDATEGNSAYRCGACGREIPREAMPALWRVWRP
jgi:hypothetical protein